MKSETITMPKALTAENGAKAIFISEFKELVPFLALIATSLVVILLWMTAKRVADLDHLIK